MSNPQAVAQFRIRIAAPDELRSWLYFMNCAGNTVGVSPHLKLHQCGLPREMALQLFKPFLMKALGEHGYADTLKTARRMIDQRRPEVWDTLEEVIRDYPVVLSSVVRSHPSAQLLAFEPVLVDSKAIQVSPLVANTFCTTFDGDKFAVHLPLSAYAQAEARLLLLSTHHVFSKADGNLVTMPEQDIVVGCYYLTMMRDRDGDKHSDLFAFSSSEDAILAFETGNLGLHDPIRVRIPQPSSQPVGTMNRSEMSTKLSPIQTTTVGRLIFNQVLPERMCYCDVCLFETLTRRHLIELIREVHETCGKERCLRFLEDVEGLGFKYVMQAGITLSLTDLNIPSKRDTIIAEAEESVKESNQMYDRGLISSPEFRRRLLNQWLNATAMVAESILDSIDPYNPINIITASGVCNASKHIAPLSGIRGLTSDPSGCLIDDLPIKSNFHQGLNGVEFFVSTFSARKSMTDQVRHIDAANNLTRRLVNAAHDVTVLDLDCGTSSGVIIEELLENGQVLEKLSDRVRGRYSTDDIVNPITGELMIPANKHITDVAARQLDDFRIAKDDIILIDDPKEVLKRKGDMMTMIEAQELVGREVRRVGAFRINRFGNPYRIAETVLEITTSMKIPVRSILTCELRQGVCARCYGRDLGTGRLVDIGTATGIIAAQSIGALGAQLTEHITIRFGDIAQCIFSLQVNRCGFLRAYRLRELHDDIQRGIVDFGEAEGSERERVRSIQAVLKVLEDQVRGLLRVVELFEARKPKGQAIVTEHSGVISNIESKGLRNVILHTYVELNEALSHQGLGTDAVAAEDIVDESGEVIVKGGEQITDKHLRKIVAMGMKSVMIRRVYLVPYRGDLEVEPGQEVHPGDRLTEGPLDPQKVLELQGTRGVQDYLVREIQSVYKGQGVDINDKHVEVIVRQMLRKRKVRHPGDSRFLPGQIVDKFVFEDENTRVQNINGNQATADWVLLGITEASLATESFLSAASFQKTTRVLTEAAVRGKKDELVGLKENVIIGRLIPAGTGLPAYRSLELATPDGKPLIVEAPKREERTLPLIEEDDDIPLLGRTASRPDPLPLDGFQEEVA